MKKKTKTLMICPNCNSDNVQLKAWVKPNEDNKIVNLVDGGEIGWCYDCGLPSAIVSLDLKASAKVIGFQVVGEEGTAEEGNIHPHMDASFCLYSLSQAQKMLNSNVKGQWRLLTVWSGDVEEPTQMFKSNPRK